MKQHGRINIELREESRGKAPVVASKTRSTKPVNGKTLASVTYRAGTRMSENFHSVALDVEVTLPVALSGPYGSEEYDADEVHAGMKECIEIAETTYEREAKGMRKILRQMAK